MDQHDYFLKEMLCFMQSDGPSNGLKFVQLQISIINIPNHKYSGVSGEEGGIVWGGGGVDEVYTYCARDH